MLKRSLTALSLALSFSLALLLTLGACGAGDAPSGAQPSEADTTLSQITSPAPQTSEPQVTVPQPAQPEPSAPQSAPSEPAQQSDPNDPPPASMEQMYHAALDTILTYRLYPDGSEVMVLPGSDLSANRFAICDVDGDGADELIYLHTDSPMSGMLVLVYGYDSLSGDIYQELREFPALDFFGNGVVLASVSPDRVVSGRFWPYSIYRYDAQARTYRHVASVDAVDRGLRSVDYDEATAFPEGVDLDLDGLIYSITPAGSAQPNAPIDGPEYEAWLVGILDGGTPLELPFQALTPDNVAAVLG